MPPVQSKPVASNGNSTDLESSSYGTHDVNGDQHVYLDPNLASIMSNAVAKIKSKQLKKPPKRKIPCKYPCSVCEKNVNANQKGIKCDKCQLWSHASCNGISKSEYGELVEEDDDVPWYCIPCLVSKLLKFSLLVCYLKQSFVNY